MNKKNILLKFITLVVILSIPVIVKNFFYEKNTVTLLLNNFSRDNEKVSYIKDKTLDDPNVIYNGTSVEEGIKSNSIIEKKAKKVTESATNDREKARDLYVWIGSNIEYDNNKAEKVLNSNDETVESGAIYAFRDRSGICFDYACLYVAMARSVDLKVRLVIGEAYDGSQYVSHAWNEVYLNDENKWINVDTTFYNGGNYFDSENFDKHINKQIIGEW
jgi:transglutaminase/protease-like cytokinesis protein 3